MARYSFEFSTVALLIQVSAFVCPQGVMDGYKLVCLFVFSVVAFRTCQPTFDGLHDMTAHSRRKRYLVFPDGSTFSVSDKKVYLKY